MLQNPVVEQQIQAEKERREKEAFRHPFVVTCVVPYIEDVKHHPAFSIVKKFCEENQVPFSAREYDYRRYEEDCDHIYEMPAFHMYSENGKHYWDTFFIKDNPYQKIREEIMFWKEREQKRLEKKERWEKRVTRLVAFFENLSPKKKPKMIVPPKPKAAPAKVPLELPDKLPKQRKGSK